MAADTTEPEHDETRPLAASVAMAETVLKDLIDIGEGQTLELKTSLRVDALTGRVNKDLTKAVAKTVAGFLNAQGGVLLIGITDDGEIKGIEPDISSLSRRNIDGFELTFRNALGNYLGPEVSPLVATEFVSVEGKTVAKVSCNRHGTAVFFQDGNQRHFYVRDGNRTQPLDVRAAHEYISSHFPADFLSPTGLKDIVLEALRERLGTAPPSVAESEPLPPWLRVGTRRVIDLFLRTLASSRGWKKLYVVSPWISEFDAEAVLTFGQLLRRFEDEHTTVYVVTRPPSDEGHSRAIELMGATGRANIVLVPDLHVKLYTAKTDVGSFAMLGSANFTRQSFFNREIGVLVTDYAEGKRVVSELGYEAAQLYRTPTRRLIHQAKL